MLGAGLVLDPRQLLGIDYQQKEALYGASPNQRDGYVEHGGYNCMLKHNWALKALVKDALDGKISLNKNRMFHIDTHHDVCYTFDAIEMSNDVPDLLRRPESYDRALAIIDVEARNTNVGNWIIKLFASGLTDEVFWVRPAWDFRDRNEPPVTYYALKQWPGSPHVYKVLQSRKKSDIDGAKSLLTVREISAGEVLRHAGEAESILFDVDLDYFSCYGQGRPERVDVNEFGIKETEWFEKKYGEVLEINGGTMRNPVQKIYRASTQEIDAEMAAIKAVADSLPRDRPSSRTLAVSPDFLFPDQKEYIANSFFK
ncbi:MAG: UPF0489 family protein [Candidatus Aenigmatarchaeota archaeon]